MHIYCRERTASKNKRQEIYRRAEAHVKEYQAKERARIKAHRQARAAGNFYVEEEPRLMFVIRIRGYAFSQCLYERFRAE
jgi:large subunit ribosomal protein L7e